MTSPARFSGFDTQCMSEALALAARGCYTTTPNPNVGCVIARDGEIIGRGWHQQAGTPHAEVHALREAGALAEGATAYVTLEPCSHFGRTPPCADALLRSGVARVVVAMQDPYFQVSGRGIERLRSHDVQVDVGLLESEARALNAGFIKRATQGLPYVRVKLACSLDGRTALANGRSQWITSAEARDDVQYGRAMSSAILSGAGTVLTDNPSLNVRLSADDYPSGLEVRQPVRVLVDNQLQINGDLKLWQAEGPVWVARPRASEASLPEQGQELVIEAGADGRIDLKALMQTLASRDINDVWVEAGARLAGALMQANLVDELIVYQAPKLLGPTAAGLLDLPPFEQMQDVPEFEFKSVERIGPDVKLVLSPQAAPTLSS
ncbi:bifunctional diaminohydroxyphosphoribosylaminopyrimidine deaminase/5-amino-6-(5-phosphoribosylamino)uracil reductase RibD [Aliidiomarina sp. Khilg15.8]